MEKELNINETKSVIHLESKVLEETLPVVKVQFNQEEVDNNIKSLGVQLINNEHERVDLQTELDNYLGRKQKMIDGGIYITD